MLKGAAVALLLLSAACGSPPPATVARCSNRDVWNELERNQICIGSHITKLVTSGSVPAPIPVSMPVAQALPAGTRTLTYQVSGGLSVGGEHAIAIGPDAAWLAANGLWRLSTGNQVSSVSTPSNALQNVTYAYGTLWIDGSDSENVSRLDLTGKQVGTVAFQGDIYPFGEFPAFGSMWIAQHHNGAVVRVDPTTNRVVASIAVGLQAPSGPIAFAAWQDSLWVAVPNINAVLRLDPKRGEIVADIPFPGGPDGNNNPCGLAATADAVWVTMCGSSWLAKIDPRHNRVAAVYDLGALPTNIWVDGDSLWTAVGIDPQTTPGAPAYLVKMGADGSVRQRYALGAGVFPGYVALGLGSIWIADANEPVVHRVPLGNL